MIKKLTLTQVNRYTQDREGNPLKTKKGQPYSRLMIKTVEHGETTLSGFGSSWNQNWKPGDEVSLDVVEVSNNGKTYLNFNKVDTDTIVLEKVAAIEERLEKLIKEMRPIYLDFNKKDKGLTSAGTKVPDFSEVDQALDEFNQLPPEN